MFRTFRPPAGSEVRMTYVIAAPMTPPRKVQKDPAASSPCRAFPMDMEVDIVM
jgi:hypothetical protein